MIAYAVWKLYQHCTNQDKGRHESLSVNEEEAKQSLLHGNDLTTDVESEANVIMRTESEFEVDPTASSLKDINTISTDIATPERPAQVSNELSLTYKKKMELTLISFLFLSFTHKRNLGTPPSSF